eukprot:729725-Pelagomonas_calceolata.AAC.1
MGAHTCLLAAIHQDILIIRRIGKDRVPESNLGYKCQLEKEKNPNAKFRSVNFYGESHILSLLMKQAHKAYDSYPEADYGNTTQMPDAQPAYLHH